MFAQYYVLSAWLARQGARPHRHLRYGSTFAYIDANFTCIGCATLFPTLLPRPLCIQLVHHVLSIPSRTRAQFRTTCVLASHATNELLVSTGASGYVWVPIYHGVLRAARMRGAVLLLHGYTRSIRLPDTTSVHTIAGGRNGSMRLLPQFVCARLSVSVCFAMRVRGDGLLHPEDRGPIVVR